MQDASRKRRHALLRPRLGNPTYLKIKSLLEQRFGEQLRRQQLVSGFYPDKFSLYKRMVETLAS